MTATKPITLKGIPEDWHHAIEAEAQRLQVKKSTFLRSLILQGMKQRGHILSPAIKHGGARKAASEGYQDAR